MVSNQSSRQLKNTSVLLVPAAECLSSTVQSAEAAVCPPLNVLKKKSFSLLTENPNITSTLKAESWSDINTSVM